MPPQIRDAAIARGPGPAWLRIALAVVAALYFFGLFLPPTKSLRLVGFFVEAPGLFPESDQISFEFKLEGYSCSRRGWLPLDPRPYFPIEADNKESRFYRLVWFFHYKERRDDQSKKNEHAIMEALEDYILAHHAGVDDGVAGELGGIRVYETWRALPEPGGEVSRYVYRPVSPLEPGERRKEIWPEKPASYRKARTDEIKRRCKEAAP